MAELDALKAKRTPIKAALTRLKRSFFEHEKNLGVGSWPSRLPIFEQLYEKFDIIQTQMEMLVVDDAVAAMVQLKERDDFENASECSFLITYSANVENPLTSETPGVKLPTITLPKFDGTFKDWLPFRDTFKSLIHDNTRLSNIQKFHYLSSTLTGDAARVIQSLGVSD
ncbi:uncharacterized protein LOC117175366 [Belonocnema kinseyi]|uniref:uncharacterized protein LOC117175366 n=1 Tax=Belonocnema kinseyi TaxID=2817044 RepID=UPI00143DDF86|nr:uncharacterized protein LOC117175366 [Belonocnema kinseyi]